MTDAAGPPLAGTRILDLTDGYGAYAGRLLAALGAEVLRIPPPPDPDAPPLAPLARTDDGTVSLFEEWTRAGTTIVDADDQKSFDRLVTKSDVVLSGDKGPAPGELADVNPRLVHVVVTPFGWGLSPEWSPVDDLFVLGSGGLLHLGGYPDTGPIGAFGHQSMIAAGIFAAIAVIVGLIEREKTGRGSSADVSAQEAVAQALEDSLPTYALTGQVRSAQGEEAREAGTGIYACADGHVSMVAGRLGTARAWSALVNWLCEESDEARELLNPEWSEFSFRQSTEASDRFRRIFEDIAATKTKEELYVEGQRRGIAISPVSNVQDLLSNEQLEARDFFVDLEYPRLGTKIKSPGPPFRLSSELVPLRGPTGPPDSAKFFPDGEGTGEPGVKA